MRTSAMRVAAVLAVAVVQGCTCGTPPEECGDLVVTFTNPTDGATSPATTDVVVAVEDATGAKVELDTATLVTRLSTATEFSLPIDGTVSQGQATFSGVMLETGTNQLKVTVQKKGTACVGGKTITVAVAEAVPPKVLTFTFPQDLNKDGVLSSVELPSGQKIRADLTFTGVAGGRVEVLDGTTVVATQMVGANSASVELDVASLTDKSYAFFAKVTRGTATNDAASNPEANGVIALKRTVPTCAIDAPTKSVLGPNDDADTIKAGYQLRASATVSASAQTVELKLVSGAMATSGKKPPVMGGLSFDFDLTPTGQVDYQLAVEAVDDVGNTCTSTKTITIDFAPPVVTITSPSAGTTYTTPRLDITGTVVGGEGGTVALTARQGAMTRSLGVVAVTNGMFATSAQFLNGSWTVSAVATDAAGNVAAPVTVAFVMNSTVCTVVFVTPASRPALVTTATQIFQVTSNCNNEPVTLLQNGANPRMATTGGNGVASWTVSGLTNGNYKFRVEVGAGASLQFDEIDVVVDTNAPTITSPPSGATPTLLNAQLDTNRTAAGVQRQLTYTATVPMGARVDVCVNLAPAPGGAVACPDGSSGFWVLKASQAASDPAFTFPNGTYAMKVVVVAGSTVVPSMPLNLIVDAIRPDVAVASFVGDANGDRQLNIAELAGQPPRLQVTLGRGDVQATISAISVRDRTTNTVLNTAGAISWAGAVATVTFDQNVTTTEQEYDLEIRVTDVSNNQNVLANATADDPLDTEAQLGTVRIDKQAPDCAITQPAVKLFGSADDADSATAGYQLRTRATTSADAVSVRFDLTGAATQNATKTVAGAAASHDFTVSSSGTLTYDVGAICTDGAGNTRTATAYTGVVVDNEAPTCAFTAPVASPPAYPNFAIATSVNVGGADAVGRTVTVWSTQGAGAPQSAGSLVVAANGTASGSVTYPFSGSQTITAQVSDPAGNVCTSASRVIDIQTMGCPISFLSPTLMAGRVVVNRAADTNPGTATVAEFNVNGRASAACAGRTVTLFQIVGPTSTSLGTGTTDTNGDVTIAAALPESASAQTLRLRIDNGAGITTDADLTPIFVDLTAPTFTSAAPSASSLRFVAATNKNIGSAGVVVDTVAGIPADATVTVNGVTGALNGSVQVLYQGTVIGSQTVDADPRNVSIAVQLGHSTSGTFEIRVADEFGNTTTAVSAPAVVDVVAPGAPVITQTVTDRRAATVQLQWAATFDDGSGAGNANQGYEVRWSTASVTGNNALAAEADWRSANGESSSPWIAGTTTRVLTLPPLNTYYIGVRAIDEVDNYSAYAQPASLANVAVDTLLNPTGTAAQGFGRAMASGALNGDAVTDLIVGADAAARVYLYFGGAGFAGTAPSCTVGTPSASCQVVTVPGTASGDNFGIDVAVGQVGDSAAENKPDLLVGSSTYASSLGRAFLFFGGTTSALDTATFIEFRGPAAGSDFGRSTQVLPDIDNDGLGEVAIATTQENGGRGRIYIYRGRSVSQWQALAAAGSGGAVATSQASWIIEGTTPIPGGLNVFGRARTAFTSVGDVNGDGRPEFTIPAANNRTNKLFVFSGLTVANSTAAAPLTTGDSPTANQAFQTLSRIVIPADNMGRTGTLTGFGLSAVGGFDVINGTANDLVVCNRHDGFLDVYADPTAAGFASSPAHTITGQQGFCNVTKIADLNGDGKRDIVVGEFFTSNSSAWVFYSRANSFDTTAGGGFWQSRIQGTNQLGSEAVVGDFDNDMRPDLAVSDNAAAPGRVIVWH